MKQYLRSQMKYSVYTFFIIILFSCTNPTPRRPVSRHTKSFFNESVERNKKINVFEETAIKQYIAQDSLNKYSISPNGFWFRYIHQIHEENPKPKIGNEVVFNYEISNLNNIVLYSFDELGDVSYFIDKEDIELGLQNGLKLLKEGEEIVFIFPSYNAFGIVGDKEKIGINQTLIYSVKLIKIK